MEAHEIAETIHEHHETHAAGHADPAHDSLRRLTGIYLGVVAMLLAIATLGGGNAMKEMLNANIHASDVYGYYQAKFIRQTTYRIAADELAALAAPGGGMAAPAAQRANALAESWRAEARRFESEPKTNDGKKELVAQAKAWEARRDLAVRRDPNFDYAEALFQIAIVIGSVSIVAASRPLLVMSGGLAILGLLMMLNGFLLLVPLPGG